MEAFTQTQVVLDKLEQTEVLVEVVQREILMFHLLLLYQVEMETHHQLVHLKVIMAVTE